MVEHRASKRKVAGSIPVVCLYPLFSIFEFFLPKFISRMNLGAIWWFITEIREKFCTFWCKSPKSPNFWPKFEMSANSSFSTLGSRDSGSLAEIARGFRWNWETREKFENGPEPGDFRKSPKLCLKMLEWSWKKNPSWFISYFLFRLQKSGRSGRWCQNERARKTQVTKEKEKKCRHSTRFFKRINSSFWSRRDPSRFQFRHQMALLRRNPQN